MPTVTIRLDEETDARLKRRLARSGETLSGFIREAVTKHLDAKPRVETRLADLTRVLEKLTDTGEADLGALVEQAPKGCEVWLDGGHNAEGGRVVAAALGDLEERVSRPLVVIVGMMGNKDANAFLANFAGLTRHIIAVQIPDRDHAMPLDRLADAVRQLGMRVETAPGVEAALRSLAGLAYEVPPRILITGSLYLAGHVLAANGTPPR